MRKRVFITFVLVLFAMTLFGCKKVTNEDLPQETEVISIPHTAPTDEASATEPSSRYIISATSSIVTDLEYFGIEMTAAEDALALSDLCAIFPDEELYYLYFRIPEDNEYSAYRIDTMRINDWEYSLRLLEIVGSYQKYAIEDWHLADDDTYEISEIHFYNEKNSDDKQTYNMSQECIVYINDEQYYFQQEYRYHITLAGTLFESVYQFNKDKNAFQDLWNNVIANPSGLDEDDRSFFYFAFNCYDVDRNIHFVPDDIMQLEVIYNQLTYAYEGKDKNWEKSIKPESKEISEVIKPDNVQVTSDGKYSNKKIYEYDTINRLDDATLNRNRKAENAKTLEYAARTYDWAIQFGNSAGYPNRKLEAGLIGKTYDVLYTQIEDFKAIHIVYRYGGKVFDLDTNSLIADAPVSVTEEVVRPSRDEKKEHDDVAPYVVDDLDLTMWDKIKIAVSQLNRKIVITIIIAVILGIVVLLIRIRFRKLFRNKRLSSAVKDLIQDGDSDALEEIIDDIVD